jgi:hypothetical protein
VAVWHGTHTHHPPLPKPLLTRTPPPPSLPSSHLTSGGAGGGALASAPGCSPLSPAAASAAGTESVSRVVMTVTGSVLKSTGFAGTAVSTLYFVNSLTSTACSLLELLPQAASGTSTTPLWTQFGETLKERRVIRGAGMGYLAGEDRWREPASAREVRRPRG